MKRFAAVLTAASLLALPACGTAASTYGVRPAAAGTVRAAAAGDVSADDVAFLQMMVAHNRQGMEMAGLVADRSAREDVKELAAEAGAAQRAEATAMARRLYGWDQPLTGGGHAHGDHAELHATGPEEITTLRRMSGAAFDTRFLNVFIAHQHNAVEMARAEIRTGRNPQVLDLAHRIDRSRSELIRRMLARLSS
ncbi:DUF305 domain-containing protein [Planomonospora corallina]|uniref:DUF305 domain-containing protein n=1 Tax=Planomonospora corallina TaxID=1806052 RepID=A0ABV8I2M8_9ACTN